MLNTIESLIQGDQDILKWYAAAKQRWAELLELKSGKTVESLGKILTDAQFWFEHNCGGRSIGQEIMVAVGIGQYYSTLSGFEGDAHKAKFIYNAIMASHCSGEVIYYANRFAEMYDLDEEAD